MPPASSRVPPLLQPYVRLPPASSLHLLTSVLGASTNWLVIRYLCGALAGRDARKPNAAASGEGAGVKGQDEDVAVILVSFLRDWEFWRTESRRAGGLDLARLAQQNRFAFVDGLSNLFLPAEPEPSSSSAAAQPVPSSPLPARTGQTITPRNPPPAAAPAAAFTPTRPAPANTTAAAAQGAQQPPAFRLTSPTLPHLESAVKKAHAHLTSASPTRRTLLILDGPDLLLATTDPTAKDVVTSTALSTALLSLRRAVAHATVLALSADAPLVAAAADAASLQQHGGGTGGGGGGGAPGAFGGGGHGYHANTPLEAAHAAFAVGQAHVADWVLSLRLLDTGFAADVSGVLRATRGDNCDADDDEEDRGGESGAEDGDDRGREEKEVLYCVGGDGSVRVFERGSGGSGNC